jgi:hypothetical protein
MAFRDLFLATPPTQKAEAEGLAVAASTEPAPVVGVFITPQSLAAFPGASLAVTVVWALIKKLAPRLGASPWVPVLASLVVGIIIFLSTVSDDRAAPKTRSKWIIAVAVALFNSLYLAASALGLLQT